MLTTAGATGVSLLTTAGAPAGLATAAGVSAPVNLDMIEMTDRDSLVIPPSFRTEVFPDALRAMGAAGDSTYALAGDLLHRPDASVAHRLFALRALGGELLSDRTEMGEKLHNLKALTRLARSQGTDPRVAEMSAAVVGKVLTRNGHPTDGDEIFAGAEPRGSDSIEDRISRLGSGDRVVMQQTARFNIPGTDLPRVWGGFDGMQEWNSAYPPWPVVLPELLGPQGDAEAIVKGAHSMFTDEAVPFWKRALVISMFAFFAEPFVGYFYAPEMALQISRRLMEVGSMDEGMRNLETFAEQVRSSIAVNQRNTHVLEEDEAAIAWRVHHLRQGAAEAFHLGRDTRLQKRGAEVLSALALGLEHDSLSGSFSMSRGVPMDGLGEVLKGFSFIERFILSGRVSAISGHQNPSAVNVAAQILRDERPSLWQRVSALAKLADVVGQKPKIPITSVVIGGRQFSYESGLGVTTSGPFLGDDLEERLGNFRHARYSKVTIYARSS